VSVLEWIVILEVVLLGIAGIMALVAMMIAKQDPNDPIAVFCSVFWREFLHPPRELPIDSDESAVRRPAGGRAGRRAGTQAGATASSARKDEDDAADDDAFYGRTRTDAQGRVKKVDLAVLVEPHAAGDEVAGRDGEGIRVRVTGDAGDSRSNKTLVEIIANAMGVKPYQVTLTKGHYQTRKTVHIQGVSVEELQDRLASLAEVD
jgi:uncharacterized protein